MCRVALVGDSHLTDRSPRSVTKLGPRLRRLGFDVVSYAQGGSNTRTALLAPLPTDADWVVYCFGTNDAARWKRVPPEEFAENYAAVLELATGSEQIVLGPPPVCEGKTDRERTNAETLRYSDIARQVAERCGARFVALTDELSGGDLAEDGVHLNDHGYERITDLVVALIAGC